jgi:hypothetical protein
MTIHTLGPGSTLGWLSVRDETISREPAPGLFRQQHRSTVTLAAVAALAVAFATGSTVMLKTYREGASSRPAGAHCELVCRGP